MKDTIKNAVKNYFFPLVWLKDKCRHVNQWNVIFYTLVLIQLWIGYVQDELLHSLWGVGLLWALFLLGYNSLDRELEIALDKAKDKIKSKK